VTVNTGSGSGTVRLTVFDDNSIIDAAGNPLNGAFTTGETYTIDRDAPIVSGTTCNNNTTPTPASISFLASFTETVTGVDVADFSLTATGVTGASITGVSGSGSFRTVTVNTGSGNGTLRLDLPASVTVTDLAGNALIGVPYTSGTACTIDKTLTLTAFSVAANDGFVLESSETSGVGGTLDSTAAFFNVGDDGANRQFRSILHFDTSFIPDAATVTSATLKIKQHSLVGVDPFTTHGGLRVDLAQPSFGAAALELTDFQSVPTAAVVSTFDPTPVNGVYSASLNSVGLSNLNLVGATQLRLRFLTDDNNNLSADLMRFFSGDHTSGLNRPQLVIEFVLP
jgi:hypothetical protein